MSPPRPRSTAGSAPPTSSLLPFPEVHVETPPFLSNTRTQSARAPSSRVGSLLSPTLPQPPRGPRASTHAEELAAPSRVSKRHPGSSFSGRRHRKAFERTLAPPPPSPPGGCSKGCACASRRVHRGAMWLPSRSVLRSSPFATCVLPRDSYGTITHLG